MASEWEDHDAERVKMRNQVDPGEGNGMSENDDRDAMRAWERAKASDAWERANTITLQNETIPCPPLKRGRPSDTYREDHQPGGKYGRYETAWNPAAWNSVLEPSVTFPKWLWCKEVYSKGQANVSRLPYNEPGSAGYDLFAAHSIRIPPQGNALIGTGIAVVVPEGFYGRLAPRSSLALEHHLDVGAGVIDSNYRGEVKVVMFNHSSIEHFVVQGDKIVQMILVRIETPAVRPATDAEWDMMSDTGRGTNGFGSSGK